MKHHYRSTRRVVLVLLAAAVPKVALAELQQLTFRRHSTSGTSSSGRMFGGGSGGGGEQKQDTTITRRSRGVGGERYGGSALASVFRLTGKAVEQPSSQQSPPSSTFLARLQDRLHVNHSYCSSSSSSSSSKSNNNNIISNATANSAGVAALLSRVASVFKRGLAQGGAGLRRGSTIAALILGVACILSVAAANTVVSRPAGWVGWGARSNSSNNNSTMAAVAAPLDIDGVEGDAGRSRLLSSLKGLGRRGREGRTGRLLAMAPRFPLAYAPWWKAIQDRRQRVALTVAEGIAAEDHEVTERAEGTHLFRAAQFWGRSATIYLSYKKMQARCALELPRIADVEDRERQRMEWWDGIHELNSDRMLKLCLDLRGFYLKSGQFLGTRHDFMPKVFLKKLGKLHDDVPPMAASKVSDVLSRELHAPADELFSSFNLTHPVGSASISQVHRGVLRETGETVAVKVQYPGAERVMMSDLRNLRALAWFLQKFELNFDILSSLRELSKQIKGEFDFRAEARTLDRMHESLGEHSARLHLPQSRLSTKRVLIMSYLEGESLAQLKRGGKERFVAARKRIGKSLLHELADAWGFMIFQEGLFNADPHPGNILIMPEERVGPIKKGFSLLGLRTPKLRIGLLDWGQIKELSRQDRENVANLILAVSSQHSEDIVRCFKTLGVKLSNPDDADSIEKLALVMFDTRTIKGLDFNPFSANNVLKLNAVQEYPQDLYFVLRTVLMFRGMAQSLGVEFSLADFWAPHATRLLASPPP